MLTGAVPERLDLARVTREPKSYEGAVPTAAMGRLADAVLSMAGTARVDMRLYRDEAGRRVIEGDVELAVERTCQRCLEPVAGALSASFHLVVVESESEAEALGEEVDAVLVEGREVETAPMLEDELLLALPIIARHQRLEDCSVDRRHLAPESGGPEPDIERDEHPFAVLRKLRDEDA